ncbi:MAG: hypothetical protein M3Q49_06225 [Actinomycetota bacterium]|nr:hypothetical protein [Actinomycetota bacterium]
MLEPPYVNDDYPDTPEWVCFDCRHRWVPDGYWDYDEGLVFVPEPRECPFCGSEDTDEFFGSVEETETRAEERAKSEEYGEAAWEQRREAGEV